ncbi:hypothetical protein JXO52_13600 [bacterium]|nr:hypothetical protein [bacterium]
MAIQEEKITADLDRISRKITACKTHQFTAFKNIVAVLGLISWKISTVSSAPHPFVRLLRSLAGLLCMAVTGIGLSIMYVYHKRLRRMNRFRDTLLDELVSGNETLNHDDQPQGAYGRPEDEDPCVREPAAGVYTALTLQRVGTP